MGRTEIFSFLYRVFSFPFLSFLFFWILSLFIYHLILNLRVKFFRTDRIENRDQEIGYPIPENVIRKGKQRFQRSDGTKSNPFQFRNFLISPDTVALYAAKCVTRAKWRKLVDETKRYTCVA